MKISVIMPAYNAELYISEAIQSVINQTMNDWELIIVDDISTDRTVQIAETFKDPRIKIIKQTEKTGPSGARLVGTQASTAAFIHYFDADDKLNPKTLEILSCALDKNPDAVLAYADYTRINPEGKQLGIRSFFSKAPRPSGDVLVPFLKGSTFQTGTALMRKQYLIKTHAWENDHSCGEDWGTWVKLATQGSFIYVPGLTALEYRELPTGISQNLSTHYENMLPVIDDIFKNPDIVKRFTPQKLNKIRRQREAHVWSYMAMLNVRRKAWKESLRCLLKAIKKSPRRSLINIAKYTLTIADVVISR